MLIRAYSTNTSYGYLKSTYEKVWELEPEFLGNASSHKFRDMADPNHFLFTYWQYVTGRFSPRSVKTGRCFQIHREADAKQAAHAIDMKRYKMVCLNDTVIRGEDFDLIKATVNGSLERLLPGKSAFEL